MLLLVLGWSFLLWYLFYDFSTFSFCVLTCPSLCHLQDVSAPCLVTFFPCPDLFLPLPSPGSECPLLGHFLSMSWHVPPSAISRKWVPLPWSISSCILTLSFLLPSPGSIYPFNLPICPWCTKMFLPLCIFQKVSLSFVSACSLFSHFFTSLHHSCYSTNYNHSPLMYYCYFFF